MTLWNSYKDNKHSLDSLSFCILCTRNAFVKGCCLQYTIEAAQPSFVLCGGCRWKCLQIMGRLPSPACHMLPAQPAVKPSCLLWAADPCAALCPAAAFHCCQHMRWLPEVKQWRCPWVRLKAARFTLLVVHSGRETLAPDCTNDTGSTVTPGQHAHHTSTGKDQCLWPGPGTKRAAQREKGRGLVTRWKKLRSHLRAAALRASHGSLVHLSHWTASFYLFWLWKQLWFQMVSAPMWVPLSSLSHMFWLVLFRFATSSLAGQMQSDSLAKIFENYWIIYLL